MWVWRDFQEHYFCRKPLDDCFYTSVSSSIKAVNSDTAELVFLILELKRLINRGAKGERRQIWGLILGEFKLFNWLLFSWKLINLNSLNIGSEKQFVRNCENSSLEKPCHWNKFFWISNSKILTNRFKVICQKKKKEKKHGYKTRL